MSYRIAALILGVSTGLVAPAFADVLKETVTPGNTLSEPPEKWLGETPHFVMHGTVNGYNFAIEYLDMANATGVAGFEAKREYLQDGDKFRYLDFEFTLQAVIDGQEKEIELEFENHDFAAFTVPAVFELQGEEFPKGPFSNLEVEFEWETDGTSVNEEVAGWSGQLQIVRDSGTADDKGLIGDGAVAGFLVAEKGEDRVTVSFTVPVTEYEIED